MKLLQDRENKLEMDWFKKEKEQKEFREKTRKEILATNDLVFEKANDLIKEINKLKDLQKEDMLRIQQQIAKVKLQKG